MANVVIGTVADDKVDTEWVSSLLWLLNAHVKDFRNRVIVTRGYIGRLDRGRQAVAQVFMESTDADYLLSIDSDMVFTPKHYELLLEGAQNMDGESIVSGIYRRRMVRSRPRRRTKGSCPQCPRTRWLTPRDAGSRWMGSAWDSA